MNTPFQGLRTCIYRVGDLAKAIEWYSELLGIRPYFNEPFYVGFNVGGYELGLQPEEQDMSPKSANVETYWGVDDAEATFARLLELGATAHMKPDDVGEGSVVAAVKDPWDNLVGIIRNPHFSLKD
ncbi:MAG: VOC family protein [Saprospiraceae bacterium]|nr:VOC family protein [Saprospiraceae bacterium]